MMLEKCDECSDELKVGIGTLEKPYHFTESGLDIVHLIGVETYTCERCQIATAAIPKIKELHALIAQTLLLLPVPLSSQEFKFIRKQAGLGLLELAERSNVAKEVFKCFERSTIKSERDVIVCKYADGKWRNGGACAGLPARESADSNVAQE